MINYDLNVYGIYDKSIFIKLPIQDASSFDIGIVLTESDNCGNNIAEYAIFIPACITNRFTVHVANIYI